MGKRKKSLLETPFDWEIDLSVVPEWGRPNRVPPRWGEGLKRYWKERAAKRKAAGKAHAKRVLAERSARFAGRIKRRDANGRIVKGLLPAHEGLLGRLLAAMVPGQWYTRRELTIASGMDKPRLSGTIYQKALPRGMIERALNAERGPLPNGCPKPVYFYRLTEAGAEAGSLARMLS